MKINILRHRLIPAWVAPLMLSVALSGCSNSSDEIVTSGPASCSEKGVQLTEDKVKTEQKVTFYKDLLPILEANERGRAFKCTTCHAHYNEPNGLNNVPELTRIVESMKVGRMPRSNDRVSEKEIALFDTWRLQGFVEGSPSDKPKKSDNAVPANSQNCKKQ